MDIRRIKFLGFTLLLAGLVLCGGGFRLLQTTAQYEATAKINPLQNYTNDNSLVCIEPNYFQIQCELINSTPVLSNVVESLNLNVEWGNKYGPIESAQAIKLLRRRINLGFIPNTFFIKISFTSEDPNEAARIANAIAKSYQDYSWTGKRQAKVLGIEVLTEIFQEEEREIKTNLECLALLRKQLNIPNPDPAEELLKSNYPSYFQAKQTLQQLKDIHKVLAAKIDDDKLDGFVISDPPVFFVSAAKPPKSPESLNCWLGAALLAIGLFPTIGGFLMLKSVRQHVPL